MVVQDLQPGAVQGTRWYRLQTGIPNTGPYRDKRSAEIEQRIERHLFWFEALPPEIMEESIRARLRPRVEALLRAEATVYRYRRALFRAVGRLVVPPAMISAFAITLVIPLETGPASLLATVWIMLCILLVMLLADRIHPVNPEAEVLYWLLGLLGELADPLTDWTSLRSKRVLLTDLEHVARNIERELPRALPSGDPDTDAWMRDSAHQMAQEVRRLKLGILTPRSDSREWLTGRVAAAFESVAEGKWDDFYPEERQPSARPSTARRIVERSGALVVGVALPVLLLLVAQQLQLLDDPGTLSMARLGVLLWALVTINLALNPYFPSTLAALKDLKGLLGGKGKD